MKIRSDDYQYLLEYLIHKREEGHEFVAFFDSAAPVDREELFTFIKLMCGSSAMKCQRI